jgi:hypothetical protein
MIGHTCLQDLYTPGAWRSMSSAACWIMTRFKVGRTTIDVNLRELGTLAFALVERHLTGGHWSDKETTWLIQRELSSRGWKAKPTFPPLDPPANTFRTYQYIRLFAGLNLIISQSCDVRGRIWNTRCATFDSRWCVLLDLPHWISPSQALRYCR